MKPSTLANLDEQLPAEVLPTPYAAWPDNTFRLRRSLSTGALLGAVAGAVSLLANIIGSVAPTALTGVALSPVRLVQVYLTLLIGDRALMLNSGVTLAAGCLLYLAIGALYGMLFETLVDYFLPRADLTVRLIAFTGLSLSLWIVNFYGIMLWLQPLVLQRTWVVELIPWWVAAATHLLFGLTMAVLSAAPVRMREPID
jgi:hypothetical protein